MAPEYKQQLKELAEELVTPERFGSVLSVADMALGDTVEFSPVPEMRTGFWPTAVPLREEA